LYSLVVQLEVAYVDGHITLKFCEDEDYETEYGYL